jgi:hypothetical protein
MLAIGRDVLDFALTNDSGKTLKLSELRSRSTAPLSLHAVF